MAFADSASYHLGVCQFVDNDLFSNIEVSILFIIIIVYGNNFQSLIVQLTPKECLLVANDNSAEGRRLYQCLSRSNVLITERKRGEKRPFHNKTTLWQPGYNLLHATSV